MGCLIKSVKIQKDGVLWDDYNTNERDMWKELADQEKEKIMLLDSTSYLNRLKANQSKCH
jgi:hypothetical protein